MGLKNGSGIVYDGATGVVLEEGVYRSDVLVTSQKELEEAREQLAADESAAADEGGQEAAGEAAGQTGGESGPAGEETQAEAAGGEAQAGAGSGQAARETDGKPIWNTESQEIGPGITAGQ